ncbi:MAG TPA: cupin domain-containing protein [Thiolinea sp.]|nr:cupin domain-containing protein [Thiolinea sp.]
MKRNSRSRIPLIPPLTRLGELPVADFLRDYWQQQPLLVRQAFPGFELPLSADELAGLACDTDTSRLVLERGGQKPWELRPGPIPEPDFATLPETHWTLLVNDCEKLVPELQALVQPFRFIPDWRIDDLMISYAAPNGSVGPHVDAYDVFLLQARGQRRWQISTQPCEPDNFLPGLDLRVMRAFQPEQEWVLEPGDMLYLPPGVPHYGVAVDECMTCSIGFRAPSQAELLEQLLGHLVEQPAQNRRFTDPNRPLQDDPTRISDADLEHLTDLLMSALPDRVAVRCWLQETLGSRPGSN